MNEEAFEAYLRKELPEAGDALAAELPEEDHTFSPAFQENMAPLLAAGRGKRRPWRRVLAAAALIAALAAGLSVGAGQKAAYTLYYTVDGSSIRYSVRSDWDADQRFQPVALGYLPEGFVLTEEETRQGGRPQRYEELVRSYENAETDCAFSVTQIVATRLSGNFPAGTVQEVTVGAADGLLMENADMGDLLLLWTEGPNIFQVWGDLGAEEALKIAENITVQPQSTAEKGAEP